MDFVLFYRVIAVVIILNWLIQFGLALPKPSDWRPRSTEQLPFRVSKWRYLAICVLGVAAGFGVLGFSFVYFK